MRLSPLPQVLTIPANMSDVQLREALAPHQGTQLLHFASLEGAFGKWEKDEDRDMLQVSRAGPAQGVATAGVHPCPAACRAAQPCVLCHRAPYTAGPPVHALALPAAPAGPHDGLPLLQKGQGGRGRR